MRKNKIKEEKGSITLFTLTSMIFFLIILVGIYASTSLKIQSQEKEIQKIQSTYNQVNINDIYEKSYEKIYENSNI